MSRAETESNAKRPRPFATHCFFALFLLAIAGCGKKDAVDSNTYTALGEVMAAKTASLCEGKGGVVFLVCDSDNGKATAFGQAIDAFRGKLSGTGVKIIATESVETPAVIMRGFEPVTAEKLVEMLQKYSTADCLVSFAGMPALTPEQIAQMPSPRPKVIEVVAFNPPAKMLFTSQVVWLAALRKPVTDDEISPAQSPQERFEAHYQIVNAETASSVLR